MKRAGEWTAVQLAAQRMKDDVGTQLLLWLDGVLMVNSTVATSVEARGAVALGCGLSHAQFDNLTVTPLPEIP